MAKKKLNKKEIAVIQEAANHYEEHKHLFDGFAKSFLTALAEDKELSNYIHFIKYRLKSKERLIHKLTKKALKSPPQIIKTDNLFEKINDLAGVRLIHLHTNQLNSIKSAISRIINEQKLVVIEGPIAKIWDIEYEKLLTSFGIEVEESDSLYSSVHYIIQANKKSKITFELQVRTLMEEVWGEVSHKVGYEDEFTQEIVDAQLKILARLTSGSTRLVDCIFDTYNKFQLKGPE